ncbi:alpha/beta fold hydrolase (plasmid) [Streptomyces sp. CA-294286]|uniref:alpha/beta fold hydrolase n=1 Tax=Streptomyces sp. CA-294286 TaxID=3240070 RepID=UPI003D8D0484
MLKETVRTLTVDGLEFAYRRVQPSAPQYEPLVVLGGAFQRMYDWPQLEDAVTEVAGLVTVDLPGAGDSDWLRPEHTIDVLDAALAAVIDDLCVPRVNLYGYSYGSVFAFRYAQRHPERCARLLLGGVPARISEAQLARFAQARRLLDAGDKEGFVAGLAAEMFCLDENRHIHRQDLALRYFRRSLLRTLRKPMSEDVLDRAFGSRVALTGGLTGVPTLVFAGEHDSVSTPDEQRAFASTIEGSHFVTLPDCDHMLLMERADAATSLIESFLTETPAHPRAAALHLVPSGSAPSPG